MAAFLALALALLGGCVVGGAPPEARDHELFEQGRQLYPLALPLRLHLAPEIEAGDAAAVAAGARAWAGRLGPDAVLVGDAPGPAGCEVYVYHDDADLLERGALARAGTRATCAGFVVIGTGLGDDLAGIFTHELCHLLKDQRADSSEGGSVCAHGWLGTTVAITDQDVADVEARPDGAL